MIHQNWRQHTSHKVELQVLVPLNDESYRSDAEKDKYCTFKLALLYYTARKLGETLDFESELVDRIWKQQEPAGGITTNYYANGTKVGDTNTETTSLVVIAKIPEFVEPRTSNINIEALITLVVIVFVIGVIWTVLFLLRKSKRYKRFTSYK